MKTYLKDLTPEEIIKRLKNGEVVKIIDRESYYKMIDGVLCYFGEYSSYISDSIDFKKNNVYFYCKETGVMVKSKLSKPKGRIL